ncbi:MAG: hypothetical protein WBM24_14730, partial [Candidatus Sulfotelmatobacter sp.]
EQGNVGGEGRFAESVIQTGKRQTFTDGQVKVSCIIDGQPRGGYGMKDGVTTVRLLIEQNQLVGGAE